ncbi:MAG: hypothetical protein IH586_18490 [Anaerolineaceae bacterium]|nr:hypothetical protein [Anaerolineaceae bacterium]
MVAQYDEKGKIFTQVVAKQPVNVSIQTAQQIIQGIIYIRPGMRIKDEINGQEPFLAVTDAVILNSDQHELFRTKFLVVNVEHIVWIMPLDDIPH